MHGIFIILILNRVLSNNKREIKATYDFVPVAIETLGPINDNDNDDNDNNYLYSAHKPKRRKANLRCAVTWPVKMCAENNEF